MIYILNTGRTEASCLDLKSVPVDVSQPFVPGGHSSLSVSETNSNFRQSEPDRLSIWTMDKRRVEVRGLNGAFYEVSLPTKQPAHLGWQRLLPCRSACLLLYFMRKWEWLHKTDLQPILPYLISNRQCLSFPTQGCGSPITYCWEGHTGLSGPILQAGWHGFQMDQPQFI